MAMGPWYEGTQKHEGTRKQSGGHEGTRKQSVGA